MPEFDIVTCKHCGGDVAMPKGKSAGVQYHQNCAWYELPCSICGKPMSIHRDWKHPPNAHKECKDAQKAKWYKKPCEYCGEPIRVPENAVKVSRFHKKCENKVKMANVSNKQKLRIFLCHSSSDKAKVRDLYHRLTSDGFAPWLDEQDLLPGQNWDFEITKAVRASHIVIVCLSKAAVGKTGYVQKEIKFALDIADEQPEGSIFLIPAKLENCEAPERLRRWHWVELLDPSGYDKLTRALKERAKFVTS